MANRKKHLKRQAARNPEQLRSDQSVVPSRAALPAKTTASTKLKSKPKANPPTYTQLSTEETRVVWLELRHVIMTACIILLFFLVTWLAFHFTNIDDKIYSFFHLIPKSS